MIDFSTHTAEVVKNGRRIAGELRTYGCGTRIYLARRKQADIVRSGRLTISDAIRDGVAGWGLDDSTLFSIRAKVVPFVGVNVIDTGDLYLTTTESYFTSGAAKRWFMQPLKKDGPLQRVLPLDAFRVRLGTVELKRGA